MEDLKIGYLYGYYVSKGHSSEGAVYLGTDLEFYSSMHLKTTPYLKTRREAEQLLQRYKDSFNMISLDKQYKTRDGCEARVFMLDAGGSYPVLGAIKTSGEIWSSYSWTSEGASVSGDERGDDLIEVVPEKDVWVCTDETTGVSNVFKTYPAYLASRPEFTVHKVTLSEENKVQ